jgi:formyltetrahydrofolate synthetase
VEKEREQQREIDKQNFMCVIANYKTYRISVELTRYCKKLSEREKLLNRLKLNEEDVNNSTLERFMKNLRDKLYYYDLGDNRDIAVLYKDENDVNILFDESTNVENKKRYIIFNIYMYDTVEKLIKANTPRYEWGNIIKVEILDCERNTNKYKSLDGNTYIC